MPEWIHERAKHISAKNPEMSESQAWAIATQQSHALGKTPKGYGTKAGRTEAKQKYDSPKDDKKVANPGKLESEKVAGIAVQYDLHGNAVAAETSDEWLASHFKKVGAFKVPARLMDAAVEFQQSKYASAEKQVMWQAFERELGWMAAQEMSKVALSPELARSLIGAGAGAGLGAGAGYFGTKAMEPVDTEDSNAGRNAALGALAGAGFGAGAGYLSTKLPKSVAELAAAPETHIKPMTVGPNTELEHALQNIPKPAGLPPAEGVASPEQAQQMAQYLEYLKTPGGSSPQLREPTVRMRTGKNPGHIAQYNAQKRRELATSMGVPEGDVIEAGKGKFGAAMISQEEAEDALQRYEKLREQKPTVGQVGRYAALGATAAPAIGVLKNVITGPGAVWSGAKDKALQAAKGRLGRAVLHGRSLAGMAAAGALTSGALPLIRAYLDSQAELGKLKKFVGQYKQQGEVEGPVHASGVTNTDVLQTPDGPGGELQSTGSVPGQLKAGSVGSEGDFSASEYSTPIEGPKRARQASYIPPGAIKLGGVGYEGGMSTSEYSGPLGYGGFPMASYQGQQPGQDLRAKPFARPPQQINTGPIPTVKTGAPLTPQGRLSSSMQEGKTPGQLARKGPSLAQVSKPKGFGLPAEGATKS